MFKFFEIFFGSSSDSANPTNSANNEKKLATEMVNAADSLDIETAIATHENWKLRLELYLEGKSQENFSSDVVCLDDRCDLGKWIYGKGKRHLGKYPGFTALTSHHKLFHYTASNVVSLIQAGKKAEAEKILTTQFQGFSKMIVDDLNRILVVVQEAKSQSL